MTAIVWLASYPKSGNTWIRMFLRNYLYNQPKPIDINAKPPFEAMDSDRQDFIRANGGALPENLTASKILADLRPKAHKLVANKVKGLVFAKSHAMFGEHEGSLTLNMDVTAGSIYVVRNPLDIVPSFAKHYGISLDEAIDMMNDDGLWLEDNDRFVPVMMSSWQHNVYSWTIHDNPNLLVLKYEDLLRNPKKQFSRITTAFNLEPGNSSRLKRAIKFSDIGELRKQERQSGFRETLREGNVFFGKGQSDAWRQTLSVKQVDKLVAHSGEMMEKFGYLP